MNTDPVCYEELLGVREGLDTYFELGCKDPTCGAIEAAELPPRR